MRNPSDTFEVLLLFGIAAGLAILVYEITQGRSVNPANGQSNGPINSLDATLFPQAYPGGGEVTGSSETYTGATGQVLLNPLQSLASILGINTAEPTTAPVIEGQYGGGGGTAF